MYGPRVTKMLAEILTKQPRTAAEVCAVVARKAQKTGHATKTPVLAGHLGPESLDFGVRAWQNDDQSRSAA
jgi:hypothetical protein